MWVQVRQPVLQIDLKGEPLTLQEGCPDRRKIGYAAGHGDRKSGNFSPPVCSPTEETGKNVQTGFFRVICGLPQAFLQRSAACHHRNNDGQRIKFCLHSKCEFFENRSF
jgi:hypothetical protein